MTVSADPWKLGQIALRLLTVDPQGLGGLHLRARSGPARDRFLADLTATLGPVLRISPSVTDDQLFGGIDIALTLAMGHVSRTSGVLDRGQSLCLTMAERCEPSLAAKLGQHLDSEPPVPLILLDEGCDDEVAPASLRDRLAFSVALDGPVARDTHDFDFNDSLPLRSVHVSDDIVASLVVAALRLGIDGLRAPLHAVRATRAHAALCGRSNATSEDAAIAAALVLSHRATVSPSDTETEAPDSSAEASEPTSQDTGSTEPLLDDLVVEAAMAVLPDGILRALASNTRPGKGKTGSGAGARQKGNRRGRPLPARRGKPVAGQRIDIIATLRAAAPWQGLRRKARAERTGVLIRPGDIHTRRFQEHSDRLIIFAVDASGSAAMARLAEAKGAVELLLAEAYARRDHVALIAFRGDGAEVLLQPTRSLVQTKRQLASLPGGGGTPLAAGLKCSAEMAARSRSQGMSPTIALLTDGRANVPLPGRSGRAAAAEDASQMARFMRGLGVPSAVIDTANRPQPTLERLSRELDATYLALPRADARTLSNAVGAVLTE